MTDATKSWVGSIFAITVFTEDLAATRKFYEEVFELPVQFADDSSACFDFGNTLINVLNVSSAPELIDPSAVADPAAGARVQFTIQVENVDAKCEELTARGVEILNGPMDRSWGIRTATFRDPGGHIWEIAHSLSG